MVDVAVFGEAGAGGRAAGPAWQTGAAAFGPVHVAARQSGRALCSPNCSHRAGTLALRGPMVPRHPFPPGAEAANLPYLQVGPGGAVDTGYACRLDADAMSVTVTGPPGRNRQRRRLSLCRWPTARCDRPDRRPRDAGVSPDPLLGQRLIGAAGDRATMQAALKAAGVNPLVVAAFDDRAEPAEAEPLRAFA